MPKLEFHNALNTKCLDKIHFRLILTLKHILIQDISFLNSQQKNALGLCLDKVVFAQQIERKSLSVALHLNLYKNICHFPYFQSFQRKIYN